MSLTRTCARCAAPLPDETPEGVVCEDCAAVLESEQTMATPTPGSRGVSYRLPPQAPRAEVLGDFEIGEKLGQGGMGAVYRARQITLDRIVALKVLPEYFAADEENVARFQREARIAAGFVHANIVHVFSAGIIDGTHFIAMELVEGENLRQRMKRERLSVAEALIICGEVARGLQYGWESAHLVHRDIKPGNIFLSTDGAVKVGDLGLAKSLSTVTSGLTQTGTSLGTALYMSPEQVRGDRTFDFRSDIYSLGCTLYEMLTGQPPYTGNDGMAVMRMHLDAPLPAILKAMPGCPIPLARLVGRMLKKNARERHGSYADLIAEIEMVREQLEAGAGATGPSAVVEAWKQAADIEAAPDVSNSLLWAGLAVVLLVGAGIAWWATRPAKHRNTIAASASTLAPAKPSTPAAAPQPDPRPKLAATEPPKPATVVAAPSAPSPSAATGATAPYPELGPDGNPMFKPGIWTRLWAAEAETRRVAQRDGDWIRFSDANGGEPQSMTNFGVRARFRGQRSIEHAIPQINLRSMGPGGVNLYVPGDGTKLQIRRLASGFPVLTEIRLQRKLSDPSREYVMEFYAVGRTLTGRIDDETITAELPEPPVPGAGGIHGANNDFFRDAQLINLDGIPEGEALKLAGAPGSPSVQGSPAATADTSPKWTLADFTASNPDHLSEQLQLVGRQLRVSHWKSWRPDPSPTFHNAAVRVSLTWREGNRDLKLLIGGTTKQFAKLFIPSTGGYAVSLGIYAASDRSLRNLNLPHPLHVGDRVTFQFARIDSAIFAWVNGELVGSVRDVPDIQPGPASISADEVLLDSFETISLDGLSETEALKLAGANGASGANSANATPASYPQPGQWSDATEQVRAEGLRLGRIKTDGEWIEATGTSAAYIDFARRGITDAIVRVLFSNRIGIALRLSGNAQFYRADVSGDRASLRLQDGFASSLDLAQGHLSDDLFRSTTPHEAVFAIQGAQLRLWVDGQMVANATDSRFTSGRAQIVGFTDGKSPPSRIKKIEWGELAATTADAGATPGPQTPATATKDAPFVNSLGMKFVPVPITGGPTDGKRVLFSVWETRVDDYEAFTKETARKWQRPGAYGLPAWNVSWRDAQAFCGWLTERERKAGRLSGMEEYRLPTDHEWSCAAGIGEREDSAKGWKEKDGKIAGIYPWGTQLPPPEGAGNYAGAEADVERNKKQYVAALLPSYRDNYHFIAPVGSFTANRFGLLDLGGNLWEWCNDSASEVTARPTRGGAWNSGEAANLLSSRRLGFRPEVVHISVGFRIVLAPAS